MQVRVWVSSSCSSLFVDHLNAVQEPITSYFRGRPKKIENTVTIPNKGMQFCQKMSQTRKFSEIFLIVCELDLSVKIPEKYRGVGIIRKKFRIDFPDNSNPL